MKLNPFGCKNTTEIMAEVERGYAKLVAKTPMEITELRCLNQEEYERLVSLSRKLRKYPKYRRLADMVVEVTWNDHAPRGDDPEYDEWKDVRALDRPYIGDGYTMSADDRVVVAAFGERNPSYRHMKMGDKALLGWYFKDPHSCEGFLYVLPEARQTGVSMQMVGFMESVMRMYGFEYIIEQPDNPRVRKSLGGIGYTPIGNSNRMGKKLR